MTNPLTTEARELSPGRIRMLDHLLSRGMTLSATDVADLRKALAAVEAGERVRAFHEAHDETHRCLEDDETHPCRTIRALDGGES